MDTVTFVRQQLEAAHQTLEGTMADVTPEMAHWASSGRENPISALYAHVVASEDMIVHGMLQQQAPWFATSWAGRTGTSEPMPAPGHGWEDYGAWARRVQVDLDAVRQYAKAVYADTDAYLATMTEETLGTPLDLSGVGFGSQTLSWVIGRMLIAHVDNITGEISALKGVQGSKGYPF